ncbi:MAG: acyltransferase [Thermoguttaceae bacterium]|nr:acyltransferase [Thermoguttaceae bacterium]
MRKTYVDNIRWTTVVLVVFFHVIYMFNGEQTAGVIGPFSDCQPQDVYQYVVYPWFMFLLFLASGMTARFELGVRSVREFIRNRTRKFLVPSTVGLLVFGWATGYCNMLIGHTFDELRHVPAPLLFLIMCVSGTGPLWYIQTLWIFSVLLILVRKIEKDRLCRLCAKTNVVVLISLVFAVFGAAQILNTPIVVVYRFGIYGTAFFLGYFVFSHDEVMARLEKYWGLFAALGLISCVAFVVMYWGEPFTDHEVLDTFMCNVFAWFGSLGALSFMKKWGNFSNGFSKWMGKRSWGLYVFHYLPIAAVGWRLTNSSLDVPPALIYLAVAVSAFAGSFVLFEIFRRIPVIRWCVLGIKGTGKEKK